MNNYWNFEIPKFNEEYGSDWDSFLVIVEDNVDYIVRKIVSLYWLNDVNLIPLVPVEYLLRALGIEFNSSDTLSEKRDEIRNFGVFARKKALDDLYLDYAEEIAGTRGTIYLGSELGSFVHDESSWFGSTPSDEDWVWLTDTAKFYVYIDVKTVDEDELDEIQEIYRRDWLLPAFYQIYLIDSSFNILRTI